MLVGGTVVGEVVAVPVAGTSVVVGVLVGGSEVGEAVVVPVGGTSVVVGVFVGGSVVGEAVAVPVAGTCVVVGVLVGDTEVAEAVAVAVRVGGTALGVGVGSPPVGTPCNTRWGDMPVLVQVIVVPTVTVMTSGRKPLSEIAIPSIPLTAATGGPSDRGVRNWACVVRLSPE